MDIDEAQKRISEMEEILDRATALITGLEKDLDGFEKLQSDIQKLEAYYTGSDWKNDLKLDEEGKLPVDLKRGVLSEDGIYDLLEKNREMLERVGTEQ
ncbi:MAG: DUF4298 domain-containing protein [Ruminococcaceae bacterium]|nr:DUF4298 domain-containing protein [Oscillospiraceae bacterium]